MLNTVSLSARPTNNNVMAAIAVLICAAWILPGLTGHDPWKPDEAYTFGLVYHILQGGGWVVPTLAAEPFVDKPPFYILTAALFAKLFAGVLPLHDGARLASGFYMAVAFGFIAAAGRQLYGVNRGWVSALLVMGSFGLAVRAHQLIPDTALFAGFAIGTYGLALVTRRARTGSLWLGTGLGLGFMAKGAIAPAILITTTLVLLATCAEWRNRKVALSMLFAAAAALPWVTVWPFALYHESPQQFEQWWSASHLLRGLTVSRSLREAVVSYLSILPWYAWPALPLALWVLWGTRYSRFKRPGIQLPVALFLSSFFVVTLAGDARELHAMPLLIGIGLLATPAIDSMRRGASNAMYWFGVMGFSFFALVCWVYWMALDVGIPQRLSLHLHKLQPEYVSQLRWLSLGVAIVYTGAWLVMLAKLPRTAERPVIVWAAGTSLIWGLLMIFFIPYANVSKSYRGMVTSLAKALPPFYDCISSRALAEPQRAMLHYHAGIITYREEVAERARSCELLLVQGSRRSPPEIPPGWHQVWEGTRPGEKEEYFWLYAYGPPPPLQ